MGNLHEHFAPRSSGYALHRAALRKERLPACCRGFLAECGLSIKYLGNAGEETLLPLVKCGKCGKYYAAAGGKFMPVENLMQYEVTERKKYTGKKKARSS